jgi:hypothetical protein
LQIADSSKGRLTTKKILEEVVKKSLPGHQVVEKKPELNPMATLVSFVFIEIVESLGFPKKFTSVFPVKVKIHIYVTGVFIGFSFN